MFNMYEEQAKQAASPLEVGMSYGKLPAGRGSVALAGQAGAMMGQGAMQGLGFKTPAEQRNEGLMAIRQQFPDPKTIADFMSIGNALNNIGESEQAEKAFDQAKELRGLGKTTAAQTQKLADRDATLAFLEESKGDKLTPKEAAYFKSRIKSDVSLSMSGQVVDTAPNVFDQIIAARTTGGVENVKGIGDTKLTEGGLEKRVGSLATKVLKADLSDLDVAVTDAENMFTNYGDKNIPGLSQMNIYERQTEEGGINSGTVEAVKNILLKLRSGAAVTESEQERFLKEISGTKVMTDELWKSWIGRIRKLIEQKKKDLFAGERKDVLELYWSRQGTGFKDTGADTNTDAKSKQQQDLLNKYNLK